MIVEIGDIVINFWYLFLPILVLFTMYYAMFKDSNVRTTKFIIMLVMLAYSGVAIFQRDPSLLDIAFIIGVFCLDEFLSLSPKIKKKNILNRLGNMTTKDVFYYKLKALEIGESFTIIPDVIAVKISDIGKKCRFSVEMDENMDTDFHTNDFDQNIRVIRGDLTMVFRNSYNSKKTVIYREGSVVKLNAFTEYKFQSDQKVELQLLCIEPED